MTKQENLADPSPENPQPDGNWFRELRIRANRKHSWQIFHCLLSKVLCTNQSIHEEEQVILFESYERCIQLCAEQREFHNKHFHQLWLVRSIFVDFPGFCASQEHRRCFFETIKPFLTGGRRWIDARHYYGTMRKLKAEVKMIARTPKKPKTKNRIGVGYRDKGNARNPAWDGSPPWQEIAMSEGIAYRESNTTKVLKLWGQILESIHLSLIGWKEVERPRSRLVQLMRG